MVDPLRLIHPTQKLKTRRPNTTDIIRRVDQALRIHHTKTKNT